MFGHWYSNDSWWKNVFIAFKKRKTKRSHINTSHISLGAGNFTVASCSCKPFQISSSCARAKALLSIRRHDIMPKYFRRFLRLATDHSVKSNLRYTEFLTPFPKLYKTKMILIFIDFSIIVSIIVRQRVVSFSIHRSIHLYFRPGNRNAGQHRPPRRRLLVLEISQDGLQLWSQAQPRGAGGDLIHQELQDFVLAAKAVWGGGTPSQATKRMQGKQKKEEENMGNIWFKRKKNIGKNVQGAKFRNKFEGLHQSFCMTWKALFWYLSSFTPRDSQF